MKTQNEISLLADQELDAVVGGRMALQRPDIKPQNGVPGSGGKNRDGLLAAGLGAIAGAALVIGIESLLGLV